MEVIWREILYAVGGILGVLIAFVITRYVIPWIKTKLGESKFSYILEQVQAFMTAIEENPDGKTGTEKAEWVIDRVLELFPKMSRSYIKALIDGSMRALTQEGLINYDKTSAHN